MRIHHHQQPHQHHQQPHQHHQQLPGSHSASPPPPPLAAQHQLNKINTNQRIVLLDEWHTELDEPTPVAVKWLYGDVGRKPLSPAPPMRVQSYFNMVQFLVTTYLSFISCP